MQKNGLLENKPPTSNIIKKKANIKAIAADKYSDIRNELEKWKTEMLRQRQNTHGEIGAIVMNCNPFTLGHRYLIEYAASKVCRLYIFTVEEDKSIFKFADRIELIRKGTEDLSNVVVLPSGKFIISQLTFQDYFDKAELQEKIIDPTFDVELFAEEIAPCLNITVRFVGEEPIDKVTRQYNQKMAEILPRYGIKFVEIPRKEQGGGVISASRVRKLLDEGDFEKIAALVPVTTLEFLETMMAELTV